MGYRRLPREAQYVVSDTSYSPSKIFTGVGNVVAGGARHARRFRRYGREVSASAHFLGLRSTRENLGRSRGEFPRQRDWRPPGAYKSKILVKVRFSPLHRFYEGTSQSGCTIDKLAQEIVLWLIPWASLSTVRSNWDASPRPGVASFTHKSLRNYKDHTFQAATRGFSAVTDLGPLHLWCIYKTTRFGPYADTTASSNSSKRANYCRQRKRGHALRN